MEGGKGENWRSRGRRAPGAVGVGAPVWGSGFEETGIGSKTQQSRHGPRRGASVQVPEAWPELTPRPGSRGQLDTAPAGAGKRRSFSLTLVSLVASPLATVTDGLRAREKDRLAPGRTGI